MVSWTHGTIQQACRLHTCVSSTGSCIIRIYYDPHCKILARSLRLRCVFQIVALFFAVPLARSYRTSIRLTLIAIFCRLTRFMSGVTYFKQIQAFAFLLKFKHRGAIRSVKFESYEFEIRKKIVRYISTTDEVQIHFSLSFINLQLN